MKKAKRIFTLFMVLALMMGLVPAAFASGFSDVASGAWYEEAVTWAVENNITTGMGNGLFAPGNTCIRAQVVTFLWRSQGEPQPKVSENPFTDVKETDYFYDAVLWAVENGVTTGLSATTFGPNSPCTRGQVVTFLWRSKGQPAPAGSENPFTDVKDSDYFYDAVLWAVENGVTTGLSADAFGPTSPCTRGHVVTFLYRSEDIEAGETEWMPTGISYEGYVEGYGVVGQLKLSYEYDNRGRITGASSADGSSRFSIEYSDNGRPASAVIDSPYLERSYKWIYDENKNVTASYENGEIVFGQYCEYDEAGRILKEDYADENGYGFSYVYTYNEAGLLSEVKQAGGNIFGEPIWTVLETYLYDEQGRVIQYTDSRGLSFDTYDYSYSEDGLTVTTKLNIDFPGGAGDEEHIIVTEYDAQGKLIREEKNTYDPHDSYEPFTELNESAVTVYSYDELGRLSREDRVTGKKILMDEWKYRERAEIRETVYSYGDGDKPISVISTVDAYDASDSWNVVFVEDFARDEETYSYNEAGETVYSLKRHYSASKNEQGEYSLVMKGEEESTWEYDSLGRLIKQTERKLDDYNPGGELYSYTWTYDELGRLTGETESIDNWSRRWSWGYDAQGRLIRDAEVELEKRDSGEEIVLSASIYEYSYDDAGRIMAVTVSDGSNVIYSEVYSYDSDMRQTGCVINDNGAVIRIEITYNAHGLPKEMKTIYEAEGVTITAKYSYANKPSVPMDGLVLEVISAFESELRFG